MARNDDLISAVGVALVGTTLALSPRSRRVVRKSAAAAISSATKVARIVARGTRNLQEEQKHVTRLDVEGADGDAAPGT